MELFAALLFLIVLLVVVYPRVQKKREEALAERLEQTRDPREAAIFLDTAMEQSRRETGFLSAVGKWLRRFAG